MAGLAAIEIPPMRCCFGLEPNIDAFVAHAVAIFAEVHRVLRDDGTLWMNFGDSYANDTKWGGSTGGKHVSALHGKTAIGRRKITTGLKPKDLTGMPWRVAFALQAAGWYLRSDIIWHKPNPMPESVFDRPTKSHEYVFLLSKRPRYFYDAEAAKEPVSGTANGRGDGINAKIKLAGNKSHKGTTAYENGDDRHRTKAGLVAYAIRSRQNASFSGAVNGLVAKRNKRSVWSVQTFSYKGAHFATYPPELIRPMIHAGTSEHGCCNHCGAPFVRIIEKGAADLAHQRQCGGDVNGTYKGTATKDYAAARAQDASATKARILAGMVERKTVGWRQTCKCANPVPIPCTVIDPFAGSGTTGQVSTALGRHSILCEANPEYIPLIETRCATPLRSKPQRKPHPEQQVLML